MKNPPTFQFWIVLIISTTFLLTVFAASVPALVEGYASDLNKDGSIDVQDLVMKLNNNLVKGDTNNDAKVDIFDLASVGMAYGSKPGDLNWKSDADITNDGKVNIFDLATVGKNFKKIVIQSQTASTVYIEPATTNVRNGDSFNINVSIDTNAVVFAAELVLYFDNSVLEALSATEGNFLKKDGASTYPVINVDNAAGKVEFASTRFGVQTGITGAGNLLEVTFKAINLGSSSLDLQNVTLVDINIQPIPNVLVDDGTALVGGCFADADCDDGLFCNGQETCNLSTHTCEPGTPVDCSYLSDQCNDGICNEQTDQCEKNPTPYERVTCNDGQWCTVNDVCTAGVCDGGSRDCSDGVGCTDDSCSEANDQCVNAANNARCNAYDLPWIARCNNNPDNNPFTWDDAAGFDSVCNPVSDCTQGSYSFTHTYNILCNVAYTFESSEEGWSVGSAPFAFVEPISSYSDGMLKLKSVTNISTFGFWQSLMELPSYQNKIYQAKFKVLTDEPDSDAVPQTRLRYNSENMQLSSSMTVSSAPMHLSPVYSCIPSTTGKDYELVFAAPGDNFGISFDLLNFDPADSEDASLMLDSAVVSVIDETALSFSEVKRYTFDSSEEGWGFGSAPFAFVEPIPSYSNGMLKLTSVTNTSTFGFWASPRSSPVSLSSGKIYRVKFKVSSNVTDRSKVPQIRLRLNSIDPILSTELSISSAGGGDNSPILGEFKTYDVYFKLPKCAAGPTDFVISFDLLNFDPDDEANGIIMLDEVVVEEAVLA